MSYTTFIFDLDGTLLDTLQDLADSVNYALRSHGMPEHSQDEIRRFVGNGVRLLMERAVPDGAAALRFRAGGDHQGDGLSASPAGDPFRQGEGDRRLSARHRGDNPEKGRRVDKGQGAR